MKTTATTFLFVFFFHFIFSQDLHEDVSYPLPKIPRYGPNGRHHTSFVIGLQSTFSPTYTSLAPTTKIGTLEMRAGFLYKLRIASFFSTGLQLTYANYGYNFVKDSNKIFPDSLFHKKQSLRFGLLQGEYFLRINFDPKRGNILGKYLDFFAWAGYPIMKREYFVDEVGKETHVTKIKNFQGLADVWQYGVGARLGWNRFAVFMLYRISTIVKNSFPEPTDPSKFSIGITEELYKYKK
jgi:hypothetical protein